MAMVGTWPAGCLITPGYFVGGNIDYELRIGSEVINAVEELGPIGVGAQLDAGRVTGEVVICRDGDNGTVFQGPDSEGWQPAGDTISATGGRGLGGQSTAECPTANLGAQARRINDPAFVCGGEHDFIRANQMGDVVAEVPQRALTEDEIGCYFTVVVYRTESESDVVVFELDELITDTTN